MTYLIDTHVFIWWLQDNRELSERSRNIMSNAANEIFLSIASLWEISIKLSIGKLKINDYSTAYIEKQLVSNDIQLLPIKLSHTVNLHSMPNHHKDPFDRMIISQALEENLAIITKDNQFENYNIEVIW